MPGRRIFDLIEIPDQLWMRADVLEALRRRDIGRLFILLNQYTGVSQTRLAIACDTTQPKVSAYMRGIAKVEALEVFERIADGLDMPDPRGAIAAAQHDNRRGAHELLDEAGEGARRLGEDRNLRWTAFCPTNVSLHRVNIAVTLGDAGTAIDVARTVELGKIDVTERKASFLMDTARAFLQCGRHERAYLALRAAEEVAPQEITGRPAAHRLVRDLMATAPLSIQRHAEDFARRIGATE